MKIYEELLRLKKDGRVSALATIVQRSGSSPQKEGAKMLVRDDGTVVGTLGGGCIEAEVIQAALSAMRDGTPLTIPFELTEQRGGLVCGGRVAVFIEPVLPEPRLVVLGAGHVGKALARLGKFSGFHVTIVDDRDEYANRESLPDADRVVVSDFRNVFSGVFVGPAAFIVIATRGHVHDLDALRAALATQAGYIGLLGSRRKRALLFRTLSSEGYPDDQIARVITPVGLPIGSVTPEEIAVSIMAQIIELRRKHGACGVGARSCGGGVAEDGHCEGPSAAR